MTTKNVPPEMTELEFAKTLRMASGLESPQRFPNVGDIVDVNGHLGICTEYHKGWCCVRTFNEEGEFSKHLDFISDEERHGPRNVVFEIRDDLRSLTKAGKGE